MGREKIYEIIWDEISRLHLKKPEWKEYVAKRVGDLLEEAAKLSFPPDDYRERISYHRLPGRGRGRVYESSDNKEYIELVSYVLSQLEKKNG